MTQPYLADTRPDADATQLIAQFGAKAGDEAASRADRSRQVGNHLHYCRWREVARLIKMLHARNVNGTIH